MIKNKSVTELSDKEFREEAIHLWINALKCINPAPKFLQQIGQQVLDILRETKLRDSLGISPYAIITVNKS